jgi:hypothetical protein
MSRKISTQNLKIILMINYNDNLGFTTVSTEEWEKTTRKIIVFSIMTNFMFSIVKLKQASYRTQNLIYFQAQKNLPAMIVNTTTILGRL